MTRKNHLLPCLFALIASFAVSAQAQFFYTTNAGVATVAGYIGAGGNITLPAISSGNTPVVAVAAYAFARNTNITAITVPGSITSIGDYAFCNCTVLTNAILDNGLLSLGNGVFELSTNLADASLPASLASIGTQEFVDSTNASITLDQSNTNFALAGGILFNGNMTALLEYPNGLGGSYTIPNGVTDIGDYAFFNSALSSVSIPNSVTNIGNFAFFDCTNLISVAIGSGVENIGTAAFADCPGLTSLVIPSGVSSIGRNVFDACAGLTSVSLTAGLTNVGSSAFANCASLTNLALPPSVTTISTNAFLYCSQIYTATLGNSVNNIGIDAFWGCTNLSGIYFGGNVPASLGALAFYPSNGVTAYYLPGASGWTGFSNLTGIPAVLWNPVMVGGGANFGVQNGGFGFDITDATNLTVTVEACDDLSQPTWTPLQTLTLTNGLGHFSETYQASAASRYYGLTFP